MIKTFRHKGLETFFRTGSKVGIQPHHATKLRVMLTTLDNAKCPEDMNAPGWRLHSLVNGNWRMAFTFDGDDAELVDYLDYH